MAISRAVKEKRVTELTEGFSASPALFLTDYRGISVNKLTSLRFELHKHGAKMKVVKNRLALRVIDPELAAEARKMLSDMTAVTFVSGDVAATAKVLTQFAKQNESFVVKGGVFEGKLVSAKEVIEISNLPSREQLLSQLLSTWNAVPTGFVRVLNAVPSGWVNVLDAVRRKKEA